MQRLTRAEAFEMVLAMLDEVDRDIMHDIRMHPNDRADLLPQLDVINKVRDKINARSEEPSAS